jgi:glycosyltransferase involved in cell wall biosynthesis
MTRDIDITVAICTYNGADRVPEVLNHLHAQEEVEQVDWEVLVVDNNSTDETAEVVVQHQSEWPDDVPLRYVFEGRQGKSNAIQTAADEARGKWIAFLDDDNLPAPDWVVSALTFGKAHPKAGAFGGQIHGLFEEAPPNSFGLVKPLFALNERSETVCYSDGSRLEFAAPGAGLVVRKQAWEESIPDSGLKLLGPTGEGRGTLGEEFEMQWKLYQNGWEIWHNPAMHLQHKIPASRFTESYLKSFFRGIGLSRHYTRMMQLAPWKRPFATIGYWLADLWKLFQLAWTYRSKITADRFVRGRVEMTLYMLIAPFRSSQ